MPIRIRSLVEPRLYLQKKEMAPLVCLRACNEPAGATLVIVLNFPASSAVFFSESEIGDTKRLADFIARILPEILWMLLGISRTL